LNLKTGTEGFPARLVAALEARLNQVSAERAR
jgi:hypothetical protein